MIVLHVCGPRTNDDDGLGHGKTASEIEAISCFVFHAHSLIQSLTITAVTAEVAAMAVFLEIAAR